MCNSKPNINYSSLNSSKSNKFEQNDRLCVICDSKLFGRSDKVFCSDKCKNKYHSEIRKTTKTISAETIKILNRNHQILCELIGKNCSKYQINKIVLQRKGFNFDVISGIEQNKFGFKLQVYDFSWYLSSNNTLTIYHNPFQDSISPFVYIRWIRFGYKHTLKST